MARPESFRLLTRYGLAAGAVGLALGSKLALGSHVPGDGAFLLFFGAVMVSAWLGGLGPGLLATGATAVLSAVLFERGSPGVAPTVRFLLEGAFISAFGARLRRTALERHTLTDQLVAEVTQLRQAQEALQRSETRFSLLAASNIIGVAVGRREEVTEANDYFLTMVGYSRPDLLAGRLRWPDMTPPEYGHLDQRGIQEVLEHGSCAPFEKEYFRKDGSRVPILIGAALLERDPLTWVCFTVDLTERRHEEDTLRRRAERFQQAMQSNALPIGFFKADGTVTDANEVCLRLLGYTAEDVRARRLSWRAITPPEYAWLDDRALEELRLTGVCTPYEKEYVRRDGSRIAMLVALARLDPEGREGVAFGVDLTEHRRAQAERAELLAAAEAARAEAEAASRAKDAFLAILGHELRNPLAAVRSAVLAARIDDGRRARALDIADRQTELLGHLVDELLDLARITQGRIQLRREPVDLAQVVRRAVEATRPAIEARQHTLTVALPAESPWLDADPTRLEQVLANLIGNAAKYTPAGGHLTLAMAREGADAVLRVRDTGIGIEPAMLPRLFDPFVQADGSIDRAQGGLGIGLSLVRSLVELHGGRVEASSAGLGLGSEFTVRLPALPPAFAGGLGTPPKASRPGSRQARVLVVDDNRDAAESLAMLLELSGYEVRVAYDGPAALEAVRSERPDAVLLDIGLPMMDGYEVARRLCAAAEEHRPLLVAISGYGQDEDRRRAEDAGFDHHLVKPVDPELLDRVLAAVAETAVGAPAVVH